MPDVNSPGETNSPGEMNSKHPSDAPLYPIREVSRLTGVNAVTLRAWERRYALLCPQRTPKGHRLYSRDDIQRIERILQWLNRGVSVGQVRELLDQPRRPDVPQPNIDDWSSQRQQLIVAVKALDQSRLETLFNQFLALYPLDVCLSELFKPAAEALEESWGSQFGATLQRRVLESFLRTRIGIRLYHANATSQGATLLIDRLPDDHGTLWQLLVALAASQAGYRIQLLDAPLPFAEYPLAVERLQASAVLLCSGQAEHSELIHHQLPRLATQLDIPIGVYGPVARIREVDLAGTPIAVLGEDPVQALAHLPSLLHG